MAKSRAEIQRDYLHKKNNRIKEIQEFMAAAHAMEDAEYKNAKMDFERERASGEDDMDYQLAQEAMFRAQDRLYVAWGIKDYVNGVESTYAKMVHKYMAEHPEGFRLQYYTQDPLIV